MIFKTKKYVTITLSLICLCLGFYNNSYAANTKIQEVSTSGIKAWLIEDNSLPITSIRITFENAGSSYDFENKAGTAFMLANMLNEGAGDLDNLAFSKELEKHAIYLEFDIDKDNFYININSLSEHIEKAFELLSLVLNQPRFEEKSIERVREQITSYISKKMENPLFLANKKWSEEVFANHQKSYSHPSQGIIEEVKTITRDDLIKFIKQRFTKKNMVFSNVGDIDEKRLRKLIDKHISTITETAPNNINQLSKITNWPKKATSKVSKQTPQSAIVFGFKGVKYEDPDFFASYILNYILGGGGFESRLMKEIREKRGLAYSTYSYISSFADITFLKGYIGTRNEQVDESLKILNEEIKRINKDGITSEELNLAKNYLTGSFYHRMSSNQKLVNFLNFIQLKNLGIDYLEKRNQYIRDVSLEDVNKVARKILNQDRMVTVIIGG